jgi:cell fate regulator YaaT (PSP1 superfamily)
MLQVGDRDRAKVADGYGRCGERLCCSSWLTSFPTISIKMAKEQELPLNPTKISGACGRLLCCLVYEYEQYRDLRGQLPKMGQIVSTPVGPAKVIGLSVLKHTVTLRLEDGNTLEMTVEEMRLQYGTAVRPVEVVEQVDASIKAQEQVAVAAPVEAAPNGETVEEKPPEQQRRRRRRRGRRGRHPTGVPGAGSEGPQT